MTAAFGSLPSRQLIARAEVRSITPPGLMPNRRYPTRPRSWMVERMPSFLTMIDILCRHETNKVTGLQERRPFGIRREQFDLRPADDLPAAGRFERVNAGLPPPNTDTAFRHDLPRLLLSR